jgi:cell division protein FtsZ
VHTATQDLRGARLGVVGVGGGGGNAVNRMRRVGGFPDVAFVAINTDARALEASEAPTRLVIGRRLTRGLGAGGRPDVGRAAIEESRDEVARHLRGHDLLFLTCGMGGGTGTGATPVIAEIAREAGAVVVAVVTTPFLFEGRKRHRFADDGLAALRAGAHSLLVVPNERLLGLLGPAVSLAAAFHKADEVLVHAARGITCLVSSAGVVNVDFADVRSVLGRGQSVHIGLGSARGDDRARRAATAAVHSPLLEPASVVGAEAVLLNISGGRDMTLSEVNDAAEVVHAAAGADAEIIFGALTDDSLTDVIEVTVIAAGQPAPDRAQDAAPDTTPNGAPRATPLARR